MQKKLYRSVADRKVAGVCGGVANYLNMDPTVVRVLWTIISLPGLFGVIAYIVCTFIIPEEPTNIIDAE